MIALQSTNGPLECTTPPGCREIPLTPRSSSWLFRMPPPDEPDVTCISASNHTRKVPPALSERVCICRKMFPQEWCFQLSGFSFYRRGETDQQHAEAKQSGCQESLAFTRIPQYTPIQMRENGGYLSACGLCAWFPLAAPKTYMLLYFCGATLSAMTRCIIV